MALLEREPWGHRRDDLRTAHALHLLLNFQKKRGGRRIRVEDVLMRFKKRRVVEEQTVEEQVSWAEKFVRAFGGKDLRRKKKG